MTTPLENLSRARCGACRQPVGKRLNLVTLRRRPTWEYPTSSNTITGDGPCAVAVLCDFCLKWKPPILEAVELRDGRVVYHDVFYLEELPPEPTHVLVVRDGQRGIECLVCGRTSWHPDDVEQRFCGNCRRFHPITR